ncbi:hypothetical protein HQ489_01785 [Candidatus Woesearchaeota archaeon]|nr:hypothetical protein [Candidatus Woesearchaeota archaeon]
MKFNKYKFLPQGKKGMEMKLIVTLIILLILLILATILWQTIGSESDTLLGGLKNLL